MICHCIIYDMSLYHIWYVTVLKIHAVCDLLVSTKNSFVYNIIYDNLLECQLLYHYNVSYMIMCLKIELNLLICVEKTVFKACWTLQASKKERSLMKKLMNFYFTFKMYFLFFFPCNLLMEFWRIWTIL